MQQRLHNCPPLPASLPRPAFPPPNAPFHFRTGFLASFSMRKKFQPFFFLYSVPHFTIASKIGFRLYPVSVKVYIVPSNKSRIVSTESFRRYIGIIAINGTKIRLLHFYQKQKPKQQLLLYIINFYSFLQLVLNI